MDKCDGCDALVEDMIGGKEKKGGIGKGSSVN